MNKIFVIGLILFLLVGLSGCVEERPEEVVEEPVQIEAKVEVIKTYEEEGLCPDPGVANLHECELRLARESNDPKSCEKMSCQHMKEICYFYLAVDLTIQTWEPEIDLCNKAGRYKAECQECVTGRDWGGSCYLPDIELWTCEPKEPITTPIKPAPTPGITPSLDWDVSFDVEELQTIFVEGDFVYVAGAGDNLVSDDSGNDWSVMKLKAENGGRVWEKSFDSPSAETFERLESASSIYVDSGFVYLAGYGNNLFADYLASRGYEAGTSSTDIWIMKLNAANGKKVWDVSFSSPAEGIDMGLSIFIDSDFVFVAGTQKNRVSNNSGNDWWLAKLKTSNGDLVWEKNIASPLKFGAPRALYDVPTSLFVDAGSIYVAGTGENLAFWDETQSHLNSGVDWRIMKLDTENGEIIWDVNFSSLKRSECIFIHPSKCLDGPFSIFVDSGFVYVAGNGWNLDSYHSGSDWRIMKLKADSAEVVWDKSFNVVSQQKTDGQENAASLYVDNGFVYVGGTGQNLVSFESETDWLMVKLNASDGSKIWEKSLSSEYEGYYGGHGTDVLKSIFVDAGNVYAVGSGEDLVTLYSETDSRVIKLSES